MTTREARRGGSVVAPSGSDKLTRHLKDTDDLHVVASRDVEDDVIGKFVYPVSWMILVVRRSM